MNEKGRDLWWKPGVSEKEKELTKEKTAETAVAYENLAVDIALLEMKHKGLEEEDKEVLNYIGAAEDFIELARSSKKKEDISIAKYEKEKQAESFRKREDLETQILDIENEIKEKKEKLKTLPRIGRDTPYHIVLEKDDMVPFREKTMETKVELDLITKTIEVLTQRLDENKKELNEYRMKPVGERTQVGIAYRKSMIENLKKMIETREKEKEEMADFYFDLKNKLEKIESR